MRVNGFDIDGVIYLGANMPGMRPGPKDVIITGRSWEQAPETMGFLRSIGITDNAVYFNPRPANNRSRETSGEWKAEMLTDLMSHGTEVMVFFEDDPIQAKVIREQCKWLTVIDVVNDLTEK